MRCIQLAQRLKKASLPVVVLHWFAHCLHWKALKALITTKHVGVNILRRAMEEPLRQIVANAGDEPSVVLNEVKKGTGNFGYNAATGRIWRHDRNGYS